MTDVMSRVLAATSSYASESMSDCPSTPHQASLCTPKRPSSPSPESLEGVKRPRTLPGGRMGVKDLMTRFLEREAESKGEDTPSLSRKGSSIARIGGLKLQLILGRPLATSPPPLEPRRGPPAQQAPASTPLTSVGAPSSSPGDSPNFDSWAWDPEQKSLVAISRSTSDLEILTFPPSSYLGDVTPAEAAVNDFIRAQKCVPACNKKFKKDERPWRMRKHYVECAKRKSELELQGKKDPLARLCELQLIAQGTSLTRVRNRLGRSQVLDPLPTSLDGPRALRSGVRPRTDLDNDVLSDPDDEAEEDGEEYKAPSAPTKPRVRARAKVRSSSPSPPTPSKAKGPKYIQASTGRAIRLWTLPDEPNTSLRVIIHDHIDCIPFLHTHSPPSEDELALPLPRLIRPLSISHISSTTQTISFFAYTFPSSLFSDGTTLSIQLGEAEVHLDSEVRSWIAEDDAQVSLRIKDDGAIWSRV